MSAHNSARDNAPFFVCYLCLLPNGLPTTNCVCALKLSGIQGIQTVKALKPLPEDVLLIDSEVNMVLLCDGQKHI